MIDSREVEPGRPVRRPARRERATAASSPPAALEAGAWGVLVGAPRTREAAGGSVGRSAGSGAAVIAVDDPLAALHGAGARLAARARRKVVGVTGSTGKTSTKDILAALLRPRLRTHANRENLNTEIGLPLTILEAPRGTEALVLEMAMRGEGQIAELVAIAEPDVGVIVNVGPGAPGAARHGRARGGRQGRADPRPARPAPPASCPPASRCWTRHLRDDLDTIDLRPGRRGAAAGLRRRAAPRSRRAARRSSSSWPTPSPTTCSTRWPRWRAARALGVAPRGPRRACASRRCAARSWSCPAG